MDSEEKLFFENLLDTDEQVLWTGRPLTKPYNMRNIEWTLIDFLKVCALVLIVYSTGYLLLQKDFRLREQIYNLVLFLAVIFLINIARLVKKITQADGVRYCITDHRILIISNRKKHKIKTVEKSQVKKKRVIDSMTDRKYKVQTVKLVIEGEDEDLLMESIENGDKVLGLV